MTKEVVKKTVSLYGGSITIFFNNLSRNRYLIQETDSSPVGVTTFLRLLAKEGLMLWPMHEAIAWLKDHPDDYEGAAKAYTIKSDKGKDVGTIVHRMVENYLTALSGAALPAPLGIDIHDGQKAYQAFTNWFESQENIRVLATERIIYSKLYDYAGTYDALLEIDGQIVLCDVKTNNASRYAPLGIYPEMFLQLGAYSLAHHEENPLEQIDDVMVIRVGKDGVLNTLRASELGLDLKYLEDSFKQLVQIYKLITPLTKQLGDSNVAGL